METNEMMVLDEVNESVEEIMEVSSGKALTTVAGIGVAVLIGGLAYKKVIKPFLAKRKSEKEQSEIIDTDYVAEDDIDENEEIEESEK